jgi:glyoxylase-like metal-dependent hydrolase (beta-lactamase superfamily II)
VTAGGTVELDRTVQVGNLSVVGVPDGIGWVRPDQLYAAGGKAPDEIGRGGRDADWEPHREFCAPGGQLEMPVGTFLVRAGDRVVLVDAGYGPQPPGTVSGPDLLTNLTTLSVEPAEITDVVLTHLHIDHIGWSAVDGTPTFPAATYRCHRADWTYFVDGAADPDAPDRRYREFAARTLGPIADRFETWDRDTTLAPGIDIVLAPGHTPGSSMLVLSSGPERAVLLGDVVHHPVQLLDDEWERVVDVDTEHARRTQRRLVREFVAASTPVVGAHFPGLRFGRVTESGGRRRWAV